MLNEKRCLLLMMFFCIIFAGCGLNDNELQKNLTDLNYITQNCEVPDIRGFVASSYMIRSKLYAGIYTKGMEVEDGRYSVVIYDINEEKVDRVIIDGPEQMIMCTINTPESGGYQALFCSLDDESKAYTQLVIATFDDNGKMISSSDITQVLEDKVYGVPVTDFCISKSGELYFFSNDYDTDNGVSSSKVFCFDSSSGLKLVKEFPNSISGIDEIASGICVGEEVNVGTDGVRTYSVNGLSVESDNIKELYLDSYYGITDSVQDTKKIVFDGTSVYEYDVTSEEQSFLFSYEEVGVKSGQLNSGKFYAAGSNDFYVINTVGEDVDGLRKYDWVKISRAENNTEKAIITIAIAENDPILTEAVSEFNTNNDEYKIVLKTYKSDIDGNCSELLLADIAAGNIPDMIALDAMELDVMIDKGLAYDLSVFLEDDRELSKTDFIGSSIEIYTRGEQVYALPSCLGVFTLSGKARVINGREGWTPDEFEEFVHSLSNEKAAVMGISKESMLHIMVEQDMSDFVDWENKTCSFDSEEFKKLLQFTNLYQDNEIIPDYSSDEFVELMWSDEVVLFPSLITDVYGYQSIKALWGEEVSYIGYPSSNRNGVFLSDNGKGYVITAQSAYKEVVWQIMKKIVMNSKLAESGWPAYQPLFEEACNRAKEKKIEVTSDGEEVEQAKLEFSYGGVEFKIYAVTEEEIATLKRLINKAEPIRPYSVKIENIIVEEADAFFSGQKNVDEVAEIIQNRVLVYMNE